jgi:TetR/AcrR family acrAB operon transcriptional repressor
LQSFSARSKLANRKGIIEQPNRPLSINRKHFMVRRTKEQAEATRNGILDAAERVFVKQGVARTSLQDIAREAGVTRGAVYWHFDDKAALCDEMFQRVSLPFDAELVLLDKPNSSRPLGELRDFMLSALRRTAADAQIRRVCEIAMLKVEITDEINAITLHQRRNIDNWITRVGRRFELAKKQGTVGESINAEAAAWAMWIMVDGLLRTWMFYPTGFDIVDQGQRMIDTYLLGLQTKQPSMRTSREVCLAG